MANVLTNLAADIYKAADIVGREVVGFIPAVTINAGTQAAAQGDTVRAAFTRSATVNTSVTPSMTIPEGDDQTVDNKTVVLDQIARVSIPWTGEDVKHVNNGAGYETIYGDQIAQAMRGIVNSIEASIATEVSQNASRAVGTAGTTPFGSNHNIVNEARQIIVDNGMPFNDGNLSLVMNTSAGTNFRNLSNLYKVNEAGTASLLRQGTLMDISGIMMRESAQIASHTKGTATGFDAAGGEPAGESTIAVDGSDSGTILAGDVVTWAGDTNKYVINSTTASGAAAGNIVIGAPGLQEILADTVEGTIGNTYAANALFHRSCIELAMRPLEKPAGGDAAVDEMIVQDPHSGLVFRLSVYKGYNKSMIDITVLYKAKVWKSDGVALVLG
tara:strand:- start:3080 stop:4237 length:1158 start_codon:yes stop_codon:yes gene_type:complete